MKGFAAPELSVFAAMLISTYKAVGDPHGYHKLHSAVSAVLYQGPSPFVKSSPFFHLQRSFHQSTKALSPSRAGI